MRNSIKRPMAKRPMTKKMNKTASKKMLVKAKAKKIASAFEKEAELILADTEEAVKVSFPAKYVRSSLAKIATALAKKGISCRFNSVLTKKASEEVEEFVVTLDELQEAVDAIVDATVEEFEALLEEADVATEEVVEEVAKDIEDIDMEEVEEEFKEEVETQIACAGVKAKFRRKFAKAKRPSRVAKSVRKPVTKRPVAKRPMRTAMSKATRETIMKRMEAKKHIKELIAKRTMEKKTVAKKSARPTRTAKVVTKTTKRANPILSRMK